MLDSNQFQLLLLQLPHQSQLPQLILIQLDIPAQLVIQTHIVTQSQQFHQILDTIHIQLHQQAIQLDILQEQTMSPQQQ